VTSPPQAAPPGWYPDPYRQAPRRYWDGRRWTAHVDAVVSSRRATPNGFAIASLVLGIVGGSVLAIVSGLVGRAQIRRAAGRQSGMGLATAGIVLGCVWLGLIVIVVVLLLTGSFDHGNARRFSGERKRVARVVDELQSGLDDNDGALVCNQLFTERWATLVARAAGKPCTAYVRGIDAGRRQADLVVKSITVGGDMATARVDEGSTRETMRLVRVGGRWRVDDIRK
jgi:Domain of unknown function (DUF4190)/Protein of unknown function (DUF2510)